MTTTILEREEISQIAHTLPDEKVTAAVEFMRRLRVESDPFYGENNMNHLRAVKADVEAGLNMAVHELTETGVEDRLEIYACKGHYKS
ncbi:MAG: hypothetical protein LBJ22_07665 [Synergistaceae bacterium]|nr:hypothetical protein [Synergistaceae bacterium]